MTIGMSAAQSLFTLWCVLQLQLFGSHAKMTLFWSTWKIKVCFCATKQPGVMILITTQSYTTLGWRRGWVRGAAETQKAACDTVTHGEDKDLCLLTQWVCPLGISPWHLLCDLIYLPCPLTYLRLLEKGGLHRGDAS